MDNVKVKSVMVPLDATIKQAVQQLNETGIGILFVNDERGRVVGTVTDGDIRRGVIDGLSFAVTVERIMKKDFIFLKTGYFDIREEARKMMRKYLVEQIPVLNEDGVLEDVFLWIDLLGSANELQQSKREKIGTSVVIMAGGRGTRLDPFTKVLPKPLIPVGEKPILEHVIDRYFENGFSNFIIIVNYKKEMIKAYFGEKNLPYKVEFVDEAKFLGTAGGLAMLRDRLKETFMVTNCDTLLKGAYVDCLEWHRKQGKIMTIIGSHKEITVPYGVLCMNDGVLQKIDEKPKIDLFINTGTYIFEPEIFDFVKDDMYLDMDKLIGIVKGKFLDKIGVYPYWGGWFDIGQWDEYRKSIKEFENV